MSYSCICFYVFLVYILLSFFYNCEFINKINIIGRLLPHLMVRWYVVAREDFTSIFFSVSCLLMAIKTCKIIQHVISLSFIVNCHGLLYQYLR